MNTEQSVVIIVDDDPSIRESLQSLFRSVGLVAQAFASTREFLLNERPAVPSCLVLDVRLPGRSGLDLQAELAELGSGLPIVFITGHGDVPMSVAAMKAGAIEFLTKPFRDQDLLDAVQRGISIDRDRRAQAAILAELQKRFNSLTRREREVMALLAVGQPNKWIAAELGVSEITVKVHRGQVMRKLRAKSLTDLARIADKLAVNTTKP